MGTTWQVQRGLVGSWWAQVPLGDMVLVDVAQRCMLQLLVAAAAATAGSPGSIWSLLLLAKNCLNLFTGFLARCGGMWACGL